MNIRKVQAMQQRTIVLEIIFALLNVVSAQDLNLSNIVLQHKHTSQTNYRFRNKILTASLFHCRKSVFFSNLCSWYFSFRKLMLCEVAAKLSAWTTAKEAKLAALAHLPFWEGLMHCWAPRQCKTRKPTTNGLDTFQTAIALEMMCAYLLFQHCATSSKKSTRFTWATRYGSLVLELCLTWRK